MGASQVDGTATAYRYSPFGRPLNDPASLGNDFRYTGREAEGNGLYYYRARYYDSGMRRFLSPDPIGFGGGDINLYRYVGNDPVNLVDPDGELAITTVVLTASAVGAVIGGTSSAAGTLATGGEC